MRVQPGTFAELGALNWVACRGLSLAARVPEARLFSTLGKHRALFRGWLAFASQLMPGGTVPRLETELAILRVAHLRGCAYEAAHHARLGRRAGVTEAMFAALEVGPGDARWTPRQRAWLAAVDALVRDRDLDDAAWTALRAHYDERAAIELCLLVGHYEMLATTIRALRLPVD